jgi:hypothetical protein
METPIAWDNPPKAPPPIRSSIARIVLNYVSAKGFSQVSKRKNLAVPEKKNLFP